MAKFITTKYGTKINVEGLSPEQVAKVRSTAEDKGAYGAKGAALANQFRKKNKKNPVETTPTVSDPSKADPTVEDAGTKGTGDTYKTVDSFLESVFSDFKDLDLSGAPKILSSDDFGAARQSVYDSVYASNTKNLDRDRQRDLEATKQELANRGIPINFGGDDLYSKSVGSVNERYDQRDLDARNAANMQADQSLSTMANVNNTAYNAFMNTATSEFESQLATAAAASGALETLIKKYGLDEQSAQARLDRKMTEKIEKMKNKTNMAAIKARGAGGNSSSDSGIIIGGNAPGFNV